MPLPGSIRFFPATLQFKHSDPKRLADECLNYYKGWALPYAQLRGGSRNFDRHFCRLTTWPQCKKALDRLTIPKFASAKQLLTVWLQYQAIKIVLDPLTNGKNAPWPVDHFLTPVLAVTTVRMGVTTPCIRPLQINLALQFLMLWQLLT